MDAIGAESMAPDDGPEGPELLEGEVHRAPAPLAHEVVVLVLGEVDDAGTMPQMDVVETARLLQGVDGAVDGGGVDRTPGHSFSPVAEVRGGEVLVVGLGQGPANGLARRGDAQALGPQRVQQVVGRYVHAVGG